MTKSLFSVVVMLVTLGGGTLFVAGSSALSVSPDPFDTGSILVSRPSGASKADIIAKANKLSLAENPQPTSNVQFLSQRWHVVAGYNGSEKIFDYNADWTVKRILERAILAFRLTQGQASSFPL